MAGSKVRKAKFIKLIKTGVTMSIRHNENVPRGFDHVLQFTADDVFNILASIIFGDQSSEFPIYEYSFNDIFMDNVSAVRKYNKYNLVLEKDEELSVAEILQLKDIHTITKAIATNVFPFDLVPQIKIETIITKKPCMYVIFDYVDFMMTLIENAHPKFTYRDNIVNHAISEFNSVFNKVINDCNNKMDLVNI